MPHRNNPGQNGHQYHVCLRQVTDCLTPRRSMSRFWCASRAETGASSAVCWEIGKSTALSSSGTRFALQTPVSLHLVNRDAKVDPQERERTQTIELTAR